MPRYSRISVYLSFVLATTLRHSQVRLLDPLNIQLTFVINGHTSGTGREQGLLCDPICLQVLQQHPHHQTVHYLRSKRQQHQVQVLLVLLQQHRHQRDNSSSSAGRACNHLQVSTLYENHMICDGILLGFAIRQQDHQRSV